ncbi:hypothetical protein J7L68_00925 [bacterium]|nr:hypothetical protein [bacterium]
MKDKPVIDKNLENIMKKSLIVVLMIVAGISFARRSSQNPNDENVDYWPSYMVESWNSGEFRITRLNNDYILLPTYNLRDKWTLYSVTSGKIIDINGRLADAPAITRDGKYLAVTIANLLPNGMYAPEVTVFNIQKGFETPVWKKENAVLRDPVWTKAGINLYIVERACSVMYGEIWDSYWYPWCVNDSLVIGLSNLKYKYAPFYSSVHFVELTEGSKDLPRLLQLEIRYSFMENPILIDEFYGPVKESCSNPVVKAEFRGDRWLVYTRFRKKNDWGTIGDWELVIYDLRDKKRNILLSSKDSSTTYSPTPFIFSQSPNGNRILICDYRNKSSKISFWIYNIKSAVDTSLNFDIRQIEWINNDTLLFYSDSCEIGINIRDGWRKIGLPEN